MQTTAERPLSSATPTVQVDGSRQIVFEATRFLMHRRTLSKVCFLCSALLLLAGFAGNAMAAHPVSHVDAWVAVQDTTASMRLVTFLDDVIRFQSPPVTADGYVGEDQFRSAVNAHSQLLLRQVRVFDQHGQLLSGEVTGLPQLETLPDKIHPVDDGGIRLTWRFTLTSESSLESLTFLPQLHHDSLISRPELRLHVQLPGGAGRIDAVVFDQMPHTISLKRQTQSANSSVRPLLNQQDVNTVSLLMVQSGREFVVEITAPVPVLVQDAMTPQVDSAPDAIVQWNGSRLQQVARELEDRFRIEANVNDSTGARLQPSQVAVRMTSTADFLQSFEPMRVEQEMSPAALTAAIRIVFRINTNCVPVSFSCHHTGGELDSANVTMIRAAGSESQSVAFIDNLLHVPLSGSSWNSDVKLPIGVVGVQRQPWHVKTVRPTRRSLVFAAFVLAASVLAVALRPSGRKRCLQIILPSAAVAVAALLTDVKLLRIADPQHAGEIASQLLTAAFEGVARPLSDETADALLQVMSPELAESTFLSLRESLARVNSDDAGVVIGMSAPELTVQNCRLMPTETDGFLIHGQWTIQGRVLHWGHVHDQILVCSGTLQIGRVEDRWSLTDITLNESSITAGVLSGDD